MPLSLDPSAPADFDFIIGDWRVLHRRLKSRFSDCNDWDEFEGDSSTIKILGGFGNLEDNRLNFPDGEFRAVAMRSYCARSRIWSIWWLDGRNPTELDKPVSGQFCGDVGEFFADDVVAGQAIRVRFIWRAVEGHAPTWEQAFSRDGGHSWETNWHMTFLKPS